jgi:hypothetical protein
MNQRSFIFAVILSGICLIILPSCKLLDKSNPTGPGTGNLTLGPSVQVASSSVSPGGGTIKVNKPGDPLDGMSITAPSGAYTQSTAFNISYERIEKNTIGPNFNPITPLITIDNGGTFADAFVRVTIPCHIPAGSHPMAFVYDENYDDFTEGLMTVGYDSTHITIATKSFDLSDVPDLSKGMASTGLQRTSRNGTGQKNLRLAVEIIPKADLLERIEQGNIGEFDSHFLPGRDDCPYINHGTYAASDGQCAGQTLTALWYKYHQERLNAPFLWDRLDNDGKAVKTKNFGEDDALGLKYSAVIQTEYRDYGKEDLDDIHRDSEIPASERDMHTVCDFAHALLRTHRGQWANMYPKGGGAGHAVIIYGIKNNNLLVADPNTPGDLTKTIHYYAGNFSAYHTGYYREGTEITFQLIWYGSERSSIDLQRMNAHWKELKNGTIASGLFPQWRLEVKDNTGKWISLGAACEAEYSGALTVRVVGNTAKKDPVPTTIYDETCKPIASNTGSFTPAKGTHRYGFLIADDSKYPMWVGFQWVEVTSAGATYFFRETGLDFIKNLKFRGVPIAINEFELYRHSDGLYIELTGRKAGIDIVNINFPLESTNPDLYLFFNNTLKWRAHYDDANNNCWDSWSGSNFLKSSSVLITENTPTAFVGSFTFNIPYDATKEDWYQLTGDFAYRR